MSLIGAVLVPIFLYYLYTHIKFSKSEEAKDERGQLILLQSYKHSIAILPIGWLLLEVVHRFVTTVSYDTYRDSIWLLILITFIVQGFSVNRYRKQH
ncbi:hypothetical protein RYX56_19035 [Alkalihalophilus lindianensis]|uniref:Uncharacterized protein n=1 Tax=Alkalihalophilus lindianensis TaxID=1630542 RepID=A0ABU3XF03_9BACI|nr:hypothetical protein [Alkalihalophilus lindianensis]MDV2686468.1 hypothetical protein [Alkalihalophilus lindianensis]